METKKRIEVCVETTDGQRVEIGNIVTMSCSGRQLVGRFDGIDKKGNWKFAGTTDKFKDVYFTIAPRSIQKMYLADIKTLEKAEFDDFSVHMNAPVEE